MLVSRDANDLRGKNLDLNLNEFLAGVEELRSLPPVVFVELTQNCNLRCRMCRTTVGYEPTLDMSAELFDYLATTLFPWASIVDLRGWGESTLLPGFGAFLERTILCGPRVRLVTNALALSERLWALLMNASASVVVSVDAADSSTISALGRGSFKGLLSSLEEGARQLAHARSNGTISFNTVVNTLNLDKLVEIVRLAQRFDVRRITLFPIVASRSNPLHLHHRRLEITKNIELAADAAAELGVELRIGASLSESHVVNEALFDQCTHPWTYCYVDYAGRVGYCDHLIGHPQLTLGDLRAQSFEEIWNGEGFRSLRRNHAAVQASEGESLREHFGHCDWCYQRRYVDFEDEIHSAASTRCVSNRSSLPLICSHPSTKSRALDFLDEQPETPTSRRTNL